MPLINWIFPISLQMVFECFADIFAKESHLHGGSWCWIGAIGSYVVANAFWLFALKGWVGPARGGLIFAVSYALMAVIIGV